MTMPAPCAPSFSASFTRWARFLSARSFRNTPGCGPCRFGPSKPSSWMISVGMTSSSMVLYFFIVWRFFALLGEKTPHRGKSVASVHPTQFTTLNCLLSTPRRPPITGHNDKRLHTQRVAVVAIGCAVGQAIPHGVQPILVFGVNHHAHAER